MNSKITSLFSFSNLLFVFLMLPMTVLLAQTISPTILPYDRICAGGPHPTDPNQVFNEYQAKFVISNFDPSVTFSVVLSDTNGSFTTPTATIPLPPLVGTPPDTATDKTLTFAIPTNLVGSDKYQLRVKSSTGVLSSSFTIYGTVSTKSLPVYFKAFNGAFFINDKKPTISYCSGGSVTLTVYQDQSDPNSSPLKYPQLKYNWYKDDVLIAGESTKSLVINSPGVYHAKLNYGPCSDDNFRSQSVIATSSSIVASAAISSSSGNPFCSSEQTTLTATAGNSYVWTKDGAIIAQATSQTYQTNVAGVYTCEVDFGGCKSIATIDLKTKATIIANYEDVYINKVVAEAETVSFAEGDTLALTTTTNVSNPIYQWYLNDNAILGATQSALDITTPENYKVIISGCSMSFIVKYSSVINYNVPQISNVVTPNNDGTNDIWIVPEIYNNTNTHVLILSSLGEKVFETDNYDNSNGWPQSDIEFKNFNPVFYYIITPKGESAKKGSITLLK
ncbi:T9SS type B sorting domain-containing protein [Flavobacterium sp. WC2509]|uniref:T9SS type B sorting domain-containing protein n=1 Tax=Flavobacterium sp. WC2509 TaxID=3461406 RepID=UPI004044A3BC